ncbi:hypothetical protein IFM89_027644 [Coptis chinensis]|uniref:Uncharacterized protein n=1 Tax=Coptis chinensis TaxID=261450 RepID=A0A835MDP6_9MAGN|nr:hypothetical protein IFM89_027644 [Coptis chinensis]
MLPSRMRLSSLLGQHYTSLLVRTLKDFFDVKPALLGALDLESMRKILLRVHLQRLRKTVKASNPPCLCPVWWIGWSPTEDISWKITPTFLKNLSSPDWKIRLESIIDSVNKILEEANKAHSTDRTVCLSFHLASQIELFGDLRGRLYDNNKNLVMATLVVGGVASAMGPMVEKSTKHLKEEMKLSYLAQELISTDRLTPQSWY